MTIQQILDNFGNSTVDMIRANLASTGTNASGDTSQSLKSDMPSDTKVIVSGRPFFNTVETGRAPRESTTDSGLESKIEKWINVRGLQDVFTAKSLTWYINKFGSKLFREGGRTDIVTPAVSDARIDELTEQIADATLGITVNAIRNATER